MLKRVLAVTLATVVILFAGLEAIMVVNATPVPSPPDFTIQMPNDSTIQLIIQNQAFTSSSSVNAIVYYYRVKDHYSQQWVINRNYLLQSDSETTTFTIPPYPGDVRDYLFRPNNLLNNSTLLDFQVQAVTGYYLVKYVEGQMPGTSLPTDGYSEITFDESETSDWSNTQTITIGETSDNQSPVPTSTASSQNMSTINTGSIAPTIIPTPLLVIIVIILTAVITLIVYAINKKKLTTKQSFL